MTITYQTIIEEVNQIHVAFLQDVYKILHSFALKVEHSKQNREKILELAGSWSDITDADFNDIMSEIKNDRNEMFNREIEL